MSVCVCRLPGASWVGIIHVYGSCCCRVSCWALGTQRFGDGLTGWLFFALAGLVARAYLLEPSHWDFRERDGADGVRDDDDEGW